MINTHTEELAALYVLDLLDPSEREEFERQLATSPEIRALVGELSDGLHTPMKSADGPRRMDLLPGIHEKLAKADPGPVELEKKQSKQAAVIPWTYIWAAAASLLLMMNLILIFIVSGQSSVRARDLMTRVMGNESTDLVDQSGSLVGKAVTSKALEARISRLRSQLSQREAELQQLVRSRSALEAENREVRQFNAGWQREYMHLAARVLPFFESKDGLSRFTVIEMVDGQAFDSQQPRRGFADLAGRFLTGEGNIAGVGSEEFVGPVVSGAGLNTEAALQPDVALSTDRAGTTAIPETLDSVDYAAPADAEAVLGGSMESAMGFSVWRDDEQKGFLDIYNLPQAGEGRDAFLWVRSSELDPYVPVGYLPELDKGNGSFFYSVEKPQFTPTEILITSEDAYEPESEPSSRVLLIGP